MHALELCVSIGGIWSYRERGSLFVFFIVVWIQSFQTIRQRGCVSNNSLIDWLKSLSLFLRLFFLGAVLQPPTVSVMQLETTRRRNAFRHMGGVEMFMLNLLELCWSLSNTKICLFFLILQFCCCQRLFSGVHCWCKSRNCLWHFNQDRKKNKWGEEGVAGMCAEWEWENLK